MLGTIVSQIPIFIDADNCDNIPDYHIYYLSKIKSCLELQDNNLSNRLDATNDVFFNEVKRLETEIRNTK